MKYFSGFIKHPIEREVPLEFDAEDHPSIKMNKDFESARQQLLDRIKYNCSLLKGAQPEAWNNFESDLSALYHTVLEFNRTGPLDYIKAKIPPEYYGMMNSYCVGQIEILESIFKNTSIVPEVKKDSLQKSNKFVDKLKKFVSSFLR